MSNGPREYTAQEREYIRTKILPVHRVKERDRWVDGPQASEEELEEFLMIARTFGLDPLRRQVFGSRRKGQLVIAPTIDGLRFKAAQTGELDGQDPPEYGPSNPQGIPEWCSVTVYRKGCTRGFTGLVYWAEYARGNPTDTQREMPRLMLTKATESQALRKAFPEALGGLITLEEMGTTEAGDEPKAAPWEGEGATTARKPNPPKPSAQDALAAARQAADDQRRRAEGRARIEQAVADGVQRRRAEASDAQLTPEPQAHPPAEGPAGVPASDQPKAYRPDEDATWFNRQGVDASALSAPAEAVVLEQHGWNRGAVRVQVAGKATGQKATIAFRGPEAAVLAMAGKGTSIWVRFLGNEIAAYHVPGARARGRQAG